MWHLFVLACIALEFNKLIDVFSICLITCIGRTCQWFSSVYLTKNAFRPVTCLGSCWWGARHFWTCPGRLDEDRAATGEQGHCPPPKVCKRDGVHVLHTKRYSRDCVTSTWTSQDNFFACDCPASYRIKLLTNQCTMLPKTPNTEPQTSFEALVVKWNHPFHESDVVVANVTSQSRNP